MACQTIIAHLRFGMAVHAPLHGHPDPWPGGRLFTLTHLSMTGLAFRFPQHNMTTVREEDMVRLLIEPFPGDLLPLFLKLPDLLLFRAVCDGILMALHADGDPGHTGEGLSLEEAVTGIAGHPLLLMFFMIEGNRLISF